MCGGPNTRTGQFYCHKCHVIAQKQYLSHRILVRYKDLCTECLKLATVQTQMATKRRARAKADTVTQSKGG